MLTQFTEIKKTKNIELGLEFDPRDKFLILSMLVYNPVEFLLDLTVISRVDYFTHIKDQFSEGTTENFKFLN